ncbi:MAG TPA: tripartite tricarboxylate transporter substrate binding protein [Desulfosporosinus sp.]|nr:tripartite tricarboxylate transporter substrate binding protein [Desulfosporosinus sp.]
MKKILVLLLSLLLAFSMAGCSSAPKTTDPGTPAKVSFPTKPITMIVSYAPGGGTDLTARALAAATEKHLGQPIGVVNKTGGGGAIGMMEGANAKPDGYTVDFVTVELTTLHHLGLTPVNYKMFKPVAQVNFDPGAITVRKDAPWNTLQEFLDYAKANPKKVRVGDSGNGAIWNLAANAVEKATGVVFTHVGFDGATPAVTALVGGHIEAVSVSPAEVLTQIKAGNLKMLGIMAKERAKSLPDVKTFEELGIKGLPEIGPWRGPIVPKDTPDEVVKILETAFLKGAQEESFKKFMDTNGLGMVTRNAQEFGKTMEESDQFYGELIKELEIK